MTLPQNLSVAFLWLTLLMAQPAIDTVQRLTLADCDDMVFGPGDDLYLACHSPDDRFGIPTGRATQTGDPMDAYIVRISGNTGKIIYARRLGGASYDGAWRIAVDRAGNAYATGLTKSAEFPTTRNAARTKYGGGDCDAFLVKIAPDGQLLYSTFIGGSGTDLGNAIAVDDSTIYIGGTTASADFPRKRNGGGSDAFVCRMRVGDRAPLCTALGGRLEEKLTGIAVAGRHIYAVGYTKSPDFPIRHPLQPKLAGSSDLILTRLDSKALRILVSTFFGGAGDDSGWGIARGKDGAIIVSGITESDDLAGTSRGFQSRLAGGKDAFLVTLNPLLSDFRTTYFGGSGDDESGYDGSNVTVDGGGNIWLVGNTTSEDLPSRHAFQEYPGRGNASGFIASFGPDLGSLRFSTHQGGPERTLLEGVAISGTGRVAAVGVSFSEVESASHIPLGNSGLRAGTFLVQLRATPLPCGDIGSR